MGKALEVTLEPSETQEEFIRSTVLENCMMGPRGEGKFLPYDTQILTISGWRKAKDIKLCDSFISVCGTSTPVVGIYPQPSQQLWKLIFSDDTSAIASDDHLWGIETSWDREGGAEADTRSRGGRGKTGRKPSRKFSRKRRELKVVRTHDIVEAIHSGKWKSGGRWSIPLTAPVQFPDKKVPVDPYIIGTLLGDGSLGTYSACGITTADQEIIEAISNSLPSEITIHTDKKYRYRLVGVNGKNKLLRMLVDLKIMGCRSWEKFVPEIYLWNDVKTRLSVLQGLLDTDGTILKHSNSVSFSTVSTQLAKDVIFLVQSLGGIAKQRTRETYYTYKGEKKKGRLSYHISVRLPNGTQPFRLSRKANKVHNKGERNRPKRYIIGVEDVGKGSGVCFRITTPPYLFLINDFIPTHNTDSAIMAMTYHASLQEKKYRPIPWAVVRDTWKNLERTTYRSFMYPTCPQSLAYQLRGKIRQKDGGRELTLVDGKGNGIWIAFLFGMDTPEDLNKLLSMQLGGFWVEEAAPAMQEDIGSGISEEVWSLGITSLRHPLMTDKGVEFLREWEGKFGMMTPNDKRQGFLLGALTKDPYGNFVPRNRRAQITMNYPSEDHWTWVRFYEEQDKNRALFRIPKGENEHIDDQYRENMAQSLRGRQDLLDRLVEGRPAHVQLGIAVTPEYHESYNGGPWHRSDKNLDPMINLPVFRFWDGDLHPAPYSQDTEILTESGWKLIKDTKVGEYAITLDPVSRKIEFQEIIDKVSRSHTGDMYHWKGKNYDLRVTDDHSVPYITRDGNIYPFRRAKDSKARIKMLKAGWWAGDDREFFILPEYKTSGKYFKSYKSIKIGMWLFCAFMGLYLSEGSCSTFKKRKTDDHPTHYDVTIWQTRQDPKMEDVLSQMPFKWTWIGNGWRCSSVQLYTYLKQFGTSNHKFIPSTIKALPPNKLKIFIDYYMMGDGTGGRRIYTTSEKMLGDFQELALKCGKRATYRISRNVGESANICGIIYKIKIPQYVIDFANQSQTLTLSIKTVECVEDEKVYCVMVANNHIIYVRRNGKPMWGGNCVFAQITPRGKFMVTDTLRGIETGMGMKQFLDQQVKPLIQNRYSKIKQWRDLGDPTLRDRDPSDSSKTAAQMIEKELNTSYEGGVLRWGPRKEALKELLTRTLSDGEPMFVVSKHEKILHRSLSGGWHYNKSSSGKVSDEPDNADPNSHPASGLSHGIAKIFKYERESRLTLPPSKKKIAIGSSVQPLYQRG